MNIAGNLALRLVEARFPESVVNPKPHIDYRRVRSNTFQLPSYPTLSRSRRAIRYSPYADPPTGGTTSPDFREFMCSPSSDTTQGGAVFCNAIPLEKPKRCARLFGLQGFQCSAAASCRDGRTTESWKDGRHFAVERLLENTFNG